MKDIAIYGAGGYGREVACLINAINRVSPTWNLIGFFDDGLSKGQKNEYGQILGGITELNNYPEELSIIMAIANPQMLNMIINKITNTQIWFPNIIAPDVLFLDEANISIGHGNIIGFRTAISCNVRIGNFNRLNTDIFLGHDVVIGNYNMFNPSTRISGEVTIGNCNFFGVSSVVFQQKSIGNNTIIGANSVIIKKTKDNTTYTGNPATELRF
ncbi:MAG: acetyltransferase [Bacteroidales bacterium]|jgi:sugar O-acyltransferase (sialic acid O-acetyltransferase NeuD family)|nr:acetyltransferase [Bacteroidales bacterium]